MHREAEILKEEEKKSTKSTRRMGRHLWNTPLRGRRKHVSVKGVLKGQNNSYEVKQASLHARALRSVNVCSATMIYENRNK